MPEGFFQDRPNIDSNVIYKLSLMLLLCVCPCFFSSRLAGWLLLGCTGSSCVQTTQAWSCCCCACQKYLPTFAVVVEVQRAPVLFQMWMPCRYHVQGVGFYVQHSDSCRHSCLVCFSKGQASARTLQVACGVAVPLPFCFPWPVALMTPPMLSKHKTQLASRFSLDGSSM